MISIKKECDRLFLLPFLGSLLSFIGFITFDIVQAPVLQNISAVLFLIFMLINLIFIPIRLSMKCPNCGEKIINMQTGLSLKKCKYCCYDLTAHSKTGEVIK